MSHEISESFNDPLNNIVPRWQFPGDPGVCQRNLETGDPVEVLAHPAFPVTLSIDNEDAAPGRPTSLLPSTRKPRRWCNGSPRPRRGRVWRGFR